MITWFYIFYQIKLPHWTDNSTQVFFYSFLFVCLFKSGQWDLKKTGLSTVLWPWCKKKPQILIQRSTTYKNTYCTKISNMTSKQHRQHLIPAGLSLVLASVGVTRLRLFHFDNLCQRIWSLQSFKDHLYVNKCVQMFKILCVF